MAIDTTVGGADSNSYASVAEADDYHEFHLYGSAWNDATTPEKESALVMATRLLDAYTCFVGNAASETQRLKWPRSGMLNRNGFGIPEDVIPDELKDAQIELARLLLVSDLTAQNAASAQGLTKIKAGPIELTFKDEISVTVVPDGVTSLLVPSWLCEEDGVGNPLFEVL